MFPGHNFYPEKSEKEQEKTSTPTIDILAEFLERLRIDKEIRVHNYRNARRTILRREFEELEAKAIKKTTTKKDDGEKCLCQEFHQATTTKPKIWRVLLWT